MVRHCSRKFSCIQDRLFTQEFPIWSMKIRMHLMALALNTSQVEKQGEPVEAGGAAAHASSQLGTSRELPVLDTEPSVLCFRANPHHWVKAAVAL